MILCRAGRQAEGREGDRRVGRTVVAGRGRRTEDVDAGWGLGSSAVWGPGWSEVQRGLGSRVVVGCAGRGRRTEDVVVDAGRCSQGPGWSGAGIPVRRHACTQACVYAGIPVRRHTCMRVYVYACVRASCLDV